MIHHIKIRHTLLQRWKLNYHVIRKSRNSCSQSQSRITSDSLFRVFHLECMIRKTAKVHYQQCLVSCRYMNVLLKNVSWLSAFNYDTNAENVFWLKYPWMELPSDVKFVQDASIVEVHETMLHLNHINELYTKKQIIYKYLEWSLSNSNFVTN